MKYAKIIICFIIIAIITAFAMVPLTIIDKIVNLHVDFDKVYLSQDFNINSNEVDLLTSDGLNIKAWEVKTNNPKGVVIILSGIHSPSVTSFFGHARMLKNMGYSSLLIEMRSHGESDGEKIYLGMKEYLDINAGVEYIKENYGDTNIIVLGASMGAATAINSIGENKDIDGVISLSAYSNFADVACDNMVELGVPRIVAEMEKPFVWLYLGFNYGFYNLKINPLDEVEKLDGRPILLMHSKNDSQVPYKSFERLYKKVKNADVFIRDGNYHFISYDKYFSTPWEDTEYFNAINSFLTENFG